MAGQTAAVRLGRCCCLPPPGHFTASHLGLCLLVKALVGSFCSPNLGLSGFFLSSSVCLCQSLAFPTLLCSRGRRNSHTRHQVDACLMSFSYTAYWDRVIWRLLPKRCSATNFIQIKLWNLWHEPFPACYWISMMHSISLTCPQR